MFVVSYISCCSLKTNEATCGHKNPMYTHVHLCYFTCSSKKKKKKRDFEFLAAITSVYSHSEIPEEIISGENHFLCPNPSSVRFLYMFSKQFIHHKVFLVFVFSEKCSSSTSMEFQNKIPKRNFFFFSCWQNLNQNLAFQTKACRNSISDKLF